MTNWKDIRIIIGIIGNVISSLISLSQMPKFIQIYKKKSTEGFQWGLHVAMVMKYGFWVLYGLPVIHKDSFLVTTSNGVGFVIEAIYVVVFFIYSEKSRRGNIYACFANELVFLLGFYAITIWAIGSLSVKHTLVGVVCNVFNIGMNASIASETMSKTKSFKYMPFWLSFVSFTNAGIWTAYSLIYKIDIYVLVSNGFETLLCASQLIANAFYYTLQTTTPVDDGVDV